MSFKRYAPPPYDEVQPASQQRIRGPNGYYYETGPDGEPVECKSRELDTQERYITSGEITSRRLTLWADLPLPESLTEENPCYYPADDLATEVQITAIVEYPERGIARIDITRPS